jgi:transcriptional regulator with XRE-family HTH domain
MAGRNESNTARSPVTHFGKQVRKERVARGWTITELGQRSGIDAAHLSRIEAGKRPPTERLARAMDRVFPEREGYFQEYYEESKSWMTPGFRNWAELELKATRLSLWSPGVLDGLVHTSAYARAILATLPGATPDAVEGRTASRMHRQEHLLRDDGPAVLLIIDELCLYRRVGSREVMAEQLGRLAEIATLPQVTVQVHPAIEHSATASGFILADDAVYAEHILGGGVFTDQLSVTNAANRFEALRRECYGARESLRVIGRARQLWIGERAPTQGRKAASASKRPARTA